MILVLKLLNSRTWMTLQSSKVIFQALETSAASLTSVTSATSLASTASTALFSQNTSWSWLFDHPCHQNDQHRSLVVEWILKNPNFHWYLVPFLLEAVEASLCYFFENWLTKLKCPILRNIQILSSQPKGCFQLASEVFTFNQIQVHPVQCTHLLTPK